MYLAETENGECSLFQVSLFATGKVDNTQTTIKKENNRPGSRPGSATRVNPLSIESVSNFFVEGHELHVRRIKGSTRNLHAHTT